jgi:hypothetical protein
MPTAVAGNFTMMFGASPANRTPWASIASGVRQNVGFVCMDSRPCRPPNRSKAGSKSGAARSDIASTIAQARSTSVQSGCSPARSRVAPRQRAGSAFQTSWTIVGLAVAPTAPLAIAYSSSSTEHESFQMSVALSVTVRARS